MKRYLVLTIFTIGCNAITGIESFHVGDQDDAETTDAFDSSSLDSSKDGNEDGIVNDSGSQIDGANDSGDADDGYRDSTDILSDDGTPEGCVKNLCGGCGDSCTITGTSAKPSDDTPCHIWDGVKCSIYLAPGSYKLGCVVCTGPNTMKCQGC